MHAKTVTLTDVVMTNINHLSYPDTTSCSVCKQTSPFFYFYLRRPYGAPPYTIEKVLIQGMQVDNYWGGNSNGRLFHFEWVSITGHVAPSVYQVTVYDSKFSMIRSDSNGAWAQINLYDMLIHIQNSVSGITFQDIVARYFGGALASGKGGIMYITSLAYLKLENIYAE